MRNLRVAGSGVLSLGRHHQTFTAMELAPEIAGPVIKEILGPLLASSGIRGNALRQHLGVCADSSLQEFITVARTHPVFELDEALGSSSVRGIQLAASGRSKSRWLDSSSRPCSNSRLSSWGSNIFSCNIPSKQEKH